MLGHGVRQCTVPLATSKIHPRYIQNTESDEADALGVLWHGSFEPARLRSYPQYRTKLILASGSAPALCGMCAGSLSSGRAQPRLRRSCEVRRHTASRQFIRLVGVLHMMRAFQSLRSLGTHLRPLKPTKTPVASDACLLNMVPYRPKLE